jgi:NADH dehydrogenase [ubiquinone] 1 alpha subcomplex assembly factor 7
MSDMLRTFASLGVPVSAVSLVEVSKGMRSLQAEKLGVEVLEEDGEGRAVKGVIRENNVEVKWHDTIHDLPKVEEEVVEYIVAQEFFDALPVHQFRVEGGVWREVMVGVNWEGREGEEGEVR